MFGVRIGSMRATGSTTKCTATVRFSGPMVVNTKGNTKMIRSTAKALSIGLMGAGTQEAGLMGSSTAKENIIWPTGTKRSANGWKASASNGLSSRRSRRAKRIWHDFYCMLCIVK